MRWCARASGRDDAEDAKGAAAGAASDKEEPPKEETFNAEKFHNAANLRGMVGATKAVSQVAMRRIQGEVRARSPTRPSNSRSSRQPARGCTTILPTPPRGGSSRPTG